MQKHLIFNQYVSEINLERKKKIVMVFLQDRFLCQCPGDTGNVDLIGNVHMIFVRGIREPRGLPRDEVNFRYEIY